MALTTEAQQIEITDIVSPKTSIGYKITEFGFIPEDWHQATLGDKTIKIGSGITPTGDERIYKQTGRPFLRSQNIGNGHLLLDAIAYIDDETHESFKSTEVKEKDVLLNITGASIGRCAVADERVQGGNVNQHVCIIRANKNELDSDFLNYFLLSCAGQSQIDSFQAGGNREGLNFGQIKSFTLPCPSLKEQKTIAAALKDMDSMINSLDQLIAKKRNIKLAAMQQLLTGKQRLPGFKHEWSMRKIGEFTDCLSGGTPSTFVSDYWGGSIRWMSSGELNFKTIMDVEGRITEKGLHNSSTKMIPRKCVLIGLAGQGKTRGTAAINLIELCTNQSIAAILPNNQFIPEYLYYNLDARYEELRGLSTGDGGRGGLNLTIIRSLEIPFPKIEEQAAIAKVLTDMDTELSTLEQRLDKARNLKHGMMQELLTGRIRLK